jgi:hypothetical protein
MSVELIHELRRIAKISYGATIGEARSVSKVQRDAADLIEQLQRDNAALTFERDELRELHTDGCRQAYQYMGIEDDGEYRWKWVLLGISQLADEASGLRAARIAYAGEFPPDAEGLPDVGNIHANIRAIKRDLAALMADKEDEVQLHREAMGIAAAYRATLRDIAEQDTVEMALDPTWAKRVARAALAQREQS